MGNATFKSVWARLYKQKEIHILMCGLDAAGKTTTLYKLKLGEVITTIPTIGINVETVNYKNVNFTAWDIGGRDKIRPLFRHYYQNTDVLIYVVDSNDRERMSDSRDELHSFLSEEELKDCIVLVMANKQDLPNALSVAEITDQLGLDKIRGRTWTIQGTCATTGDGLYDGLDWLQDQLKMKELKKSITKPLSETGEAVAAKSGLLASWFSRIGNYFYGRSMPAATH